jgi:CheY-like chemotaxis protein
LDNHPLQSLIVLLIEDDSETLQSFQEALQEAGAVIHKAMSAEDALNMLNNGIRPNRILGQTHQCQLSVGAT